MRDTRELTAEEFDVLYMALRKAKVEDKYNDDKMKTVEELLMALRRGEIRISA